MPMKPLLTTAVLAVLATLGSAGPAAAQTAWNLSQAHCTQNATASGSFGNTWTCPSGTPATSVTLSAWSSDRGSASTGNATANTYFLSGSGYASAFLSPQGTSGFGAVSRLEAQQALIGGDSTPLTPGSPNHAFDSISPGTIDLLLLNFSSSVVLSQIGIGWTQGDADVTVMRWGGAGNPFLANGTSTLSGDGERNLSDALGGTGWSLVGSYSNLAADNNVFGGAARNTGATDAMASSWWLVSTFNTTLNGGTRNCTAADGTITVCLPSSLVGNDSFKFNYIAFRTPETPPGQVSEPASLALLGIAALAWVASSRRRTAAAA
jgi:hypothetical protein